MKTQIRKPVREKARYTKEYKEQALELWRASWGKDRVKSQFFDRSTASSSQRRARPGRGMGLRFRRQAHFGESPK